MSNWERRREELLIKLASLDRELNKLYRELNSARTDPVRRDALLPCYEKLLAEREATRAELKAVEDALTAQSGTKRRGRKGADGNATATSGPREG